MQTSYNTFCGFYALQAKRRLFAGEAGSMAPMSSLAGLEKVRAACMRREGCVS